MGIEDFKSCLDTAFELVVCKIEEGTVRRFTQAVGDTSPRWKAAVPPGLIPTIGFEQILQKLLDTLPGATILHGSTDVDYYRPVTVGDVVTANIEVTGIRERQGQMGMTAFITIETSYTNQRQEAVARCRQMIITY